MGDDTGHDGAEVGAEGAAAVEAKPADPEEDGADDDVGDVVRAVGEAMAGVVAMALAEHETVGESGGARGDVDGGSAGEVETAKFVDPAGRVPGPACDGVVDDG